MSIFCFGKQSLQRSDSSGNGQLLTEIIKPVYSLFDRLLATAYTPPGVPAQLDLEVNDGGFD